VTSRHRPPVKSTTLHSHQSESSRSTPNVSARSVYCQSMGIIILGSWVRIPLSPPPWPKPLILRVNPGAIKPISGRYFSFELRTPTRLGAPNSLRKTHFSPKDSAVQYGSRKFQRLERLIDPTKRGSEATLGQARATIRTRRDHSSAARSQRSDP
jgi:hypothetical protein